MNGRIKRLRGEFVNSERVVDIERALIITEIYKTNEEKPQIIKKAISDMAQDHTRGLRLVS